MSTIIAVLLVLAVSSPILLKVLEKLGLQVSDQQYELLRKAVEDAVCHVHKVTDSKEVAGSDKKEQAIALAKSIATKSGVSDERQELIGDLIESLLWRQENDDIVEEDAY